MKLKLDIPTSLSEVTLRQYKAYLKIKDDNTKLEILNTRIIEIFCKAKLKDVMLLRLSDSDEIIKIIHNLFDKNPSLVKSFKLNNKEYGFHPELDDLTLGEYIDLDTYIGDWDNMEKAMNVLYRPILTKLKDRYSIEDYIVENDAQMLDMPMDAVLGAIFFLWNLGIDLSKTMMNYLEAEDQVDQHLTQYLNSQQNGVGINQFTDSLKEILDDLKISLN